MTAASSPIPVTVIGGYLGAGKTTLLNRLLRTTTGVRWAVLVNDFGSIDIDSELIGDRDGDTISLANGCICCSIADGFLQAMTGLLERPDPPDRIVIETSGISDPMAVAQYAHLPGFALDAVIVLADAEQIRRQAADRYVGRQVRAQLEGADVVVLTKTDVVTADQASTVRHWLRELVPEARVIEASHGHVPEWVLSAPGIEPARRPVTSTATDDPPYRTWVLTPSEVLTRDEVARLVADLPDGVVRAKGFVHLADDPDRRYVLQLVGRRWTLTPGDAWAAEPPATRLVVIAGPAPDHPQERT